MITHAEISRSGASFGQFFAFLLIIITCREMNNPRVGNFFFQHMPHRHGNAIPSAGLL
jgi:hypothetical protein